MTCEVTALSKQADRYDENNRGLSLRLEGTNHDHRVSLHFDLDIPVENDAQVNLLTMIEERLAKHLEQGHNVLSTLLGKDVLAFHSRFKLGEIVPESLRVWRFECERHTQSAGWSVTQRFNLRQPLNFTRVTEGNYREVTGTTAIENDTPISLTVRINVQTGVMRFAVLEPISGKMIPPFVGDEAARLSLRGIVEVELREPTISKGL